MNDILKFELARAKFVVDYLTKLQLTEQLHQQAIPEQQLVQQKRSVAGVTQQLDQPKFIPPRTIYRTEIHKQIFDYMLQHQNQTYIGIGNRFDLSQQTISRLAMLWNFPPRMAVR